MSLNHLSQNWGQVQDTPVLAADRPYAHDVCESAAVFFDPLSPADLADKAFCLLQNRGLSSEMIQRGRALLSRRAVDIRYRGMIDALVRSA